MCSDATKPPKMTFENILGEIGGFGPFQIAVMIVVGVPRMVVPLNFLLNNFIAAVPPHRCALHHGLLGNLTDEQRLTVGLPAREDGGPESCEMFPEPQLQLLANGGDGGRLPTVRCERGWVYDNATVTSTIATEWDLVCDRESLSKTSSSVFFVGVMVGAVVWGHLSDRYGRRPALLASYLTAAIFGVSTAFANSYILFVGLRFLTGAGIAGTFSTSIVLGIEWVDTGHRSFISVIGSLVFSVGDMLLAGLAFLIRDWWTLVMVVPAPLAFGLLSWWWVPESARWLLANGKAARAEIYLDRCAEFNKRRKLPPSLMREMVSNMNVSAKRGRSYTYLDLIRTLKMRRLTLVVGTLWLGIAVSYYGISMNITGFGLNMYLTHFLYAAIEVPAKIATYCFVNVIGRRRCQSGSLLLTGVCVAGNLFVPEGLWLLRAVVAVMGKGFSGAALTTVYLYTSELYPTVLRQNAMSFTSVLCRLGSSVAPLVLLLGAAWGPLPQVIICSTAVACGLLCLLLPDTLNVQLPETIDDIEKPGLVDK